MKRDMFVPEGKITNPKCHRYNFNSNRNGRKVNYDGQLVNATSGLIQGCGDSPLNAGVCLAPLINTVNKMMSETPGDSLTLGLIDDVTLCGHESKGYEATECFRSAGPPRGCVLNVPKTIIYALDSLAKVAPGTLAGAQRILATEGIDVGSKRESDGMRLLGTPIGTPKFSVKYVRQRWLQKYVPVLEALRTVRHPHAKWRIFGSLSISSGMVHILRTTPPHHIADVLRELDDSIMSFFEEQIAGCKLQPWQKQLARLPISLGGFGISPLHVLSPCAYLASLLANKAAIIALRKATSPDVVKRIDSKIAAVVALLNQTYPSARLPELNEKTKQRDLVRAVLEDQVEEILALCPEKYKDRISALIKGQ
jgi:hypothetical protein